MATNAVAGDAVELKEGEEVTKGKVGEDECPVCHEQLTDPKILPCGHLLCQHCVLGLLQALLQAGCPLCRVGILHKSNGEVVPSDAQAAVDALPTDVATAAIVESRQLLQGQHNCVACQTEIFSHVCLTCHDRFCSHCAAGNKRTSMTRDHNVQELANVTALQLASSRPSFCKVHTDQVCITIMHS
jgi:tripartite motif-containing protein 2/3